jgi:hypothetical protein
MVMIAWSTDGSDQHGICGPDRTRLAGANEGRPQPAPGLLPRPRVPDDSNVACTHRTNNSIRTRDAAGARGQRCPGGQRADEKLIGQIAETEREATTLDLPPATTRLLIDFLKVIGAGKGVTLVPMEAEITTPQAAAPHYHGRPKAPWCGTTIWVSCLIRERARRLVVASFKCSATNPSAKPSPCSQRWPRSGRPTACFRLGSPKRALPVSGPPPPRCACSPRFRVAFAGQDQAPITRRADRPFWRRR